LALSLLALVGYMSGHSLAGEGPYYGYCPPTVPYYGYCPPTTTGPPPPPPPPPLTPCKVTGGGRIPVFNTFGFVARPTEGGARGNLEYQDHTEGLNVQAVTIDSVGCSSPTSATIEGTATVNHADPPQTFVVEVTDNDEPGRGSDTFSIILSGGYSASGTLTGGNIQIFFG
jgi:hypothetical protein